MKKIIIVAVGIATIFMVTASTMANTWHSDQEFKANLKDTIFDSLYTPLSIDTEYVFGKNNDFRAMAAFDHELKWYHPDTTPAAEMTNENRSPVPEPATMLLFGAGLVCLAGMRQKKGRK